MKVEEIMTRSPETLDVSATLRDAAQKLYESEFRHLPVVEEDGQIVGLLSDRDIRGYSLLLDLNAEEDENVAELLDTKLVDLIQGDVITVEPATEISELIDLMIDHKVGAVPVIEAGGERVVGIVSYVDVLRNLSDRLAE